MSDENEIVSESVPPSVDEFDESQSMNGKDDGNATAADENIVEEQEVIDEKESNPTESVENEETESEQKNEIDEDATSSNDDTPDKVVDSIEESIDEQDTEEQNDAANGEETEEKSESDEIDESNTRIGETNTENDSTIIESTSPTDEEVTKIANENDESQVAFGVTPQKSNKMSKSTSNKGSNDNIDGRKDNLQQSSQNDTPSSKSTPTNNKLFNKFASWKSKADAVIQNSEVLKAAQKSIEEKTKEVQKAVKINLSNNANGNHEQQRSDKKSNDDQDQNVTSNNAPPQDAGQRLKSEEKGEMNGDVKISAPTIETDTALLNTYVEGDDQSKQSRLTLEEDDFSYDSRDVSSRNDSESEQSSIFIDNDDAFSHSTYSSDQSSVRIRSPPRRRNYRHGSASPAASSTPTRSSSAKSSSKSPGLSSFTTGSGSASTSQNDEPPAVPSVPRQLFNFEDVAKKRPSTNNNEMKVEEVSNTVTKGRYTQTISRPAILQHLQRKVRVPSPPTIPESSSSSSIITSNAHMNESVQDAKDKQHTRIRRYLGPQVMDVVLSELEKGEYLMFLGPGMLGVNLKQTFLKAHGVYIDFIVPGGNAHKSEVIWIGDRLIRVSNTDVTKGTIYDVPSVIANTKRPIVMVLNGEHDVNWEKMDNLTVAIAMINKIQQESKQDINYSSMMNIEQQSIGKSIIPPPPSDHIRKSLQPFVGKRCNEITSFSALSFACKNDKGLQHILSEAFMTCCADNRRLPFFAAFISNEDSYLGHEGEPEMKNGSITGSTRLMLFLELISFRDLFGVTPTHKRLEVAKRIAHKFFLPQVNDATQNATINPQFDMRSVIPAETIASVEACLKNKEITYDMYGDIEKILKESFGGMKFASFLLSDECARMRAYMRGTSPYIEPDLKCLFEASQNPSSKNHASAKNHLEFMIVYLLCQSESDAIDINYSTRDFSSTKNNRVMGATGGICCAIFIEKVLMPSIQNAKSALLKNQTDEIDTLGQTLIESYSHFWECFIAPSGGTLASTPLSNDTQAILDKVRRSVSLAASPPKNFTCQERRRYFIQSLSLNTDLTKSLQRLREELIYDYSVNAHPKYRGHTLHEWMCTEVNKASYKLDKPVDDLDSSEGKEATEMMDAPPLPSGCITRMFRRLEFPEGLSRHCPELHSATDSKSSEETENADYVVVFGSDNQTSPTESRNGEIPNEISFQSTLKRFVCQPISAQGESNLSKIKENELIPSTLESYAHVPLLGERQFQHITDDSRVTLDGWEVSLINFIVPCNKADVSNDGGFLYGVSLVFNLKPGKESSDQVSIEVVNDKNHRVTWTKSNDRPKLTIYIDSCADKLNNALKSKTLPERIQHQDISSGDSPNFTVGVALVSHKNVILAMRKSLSRMFEDLAGIGSLKPPGAIASPIVSILDCFRPEGDVEKSTLSSIFRPYLNFGYSSISKMISSTQSQKELYEKSAIENLVESIPPIPLALLLITALLEQKIIFTSRRRSNLISMTVGLKKLLNPFDWSHLFVPVVPAGLASDLLQYPAPFILGIPFSVGSMALLKSVPDDVTIVDVDVGRVILAKNFSVHFIDQADTVDKRNSSTAALRSQVLHLAETIGGVIGSKSSTALWNCDSPNIDIPFLDHHRSQTKGEAVTTVFQSFLKELLAGCNTCCFWIEETKLLNEEKIDSSECNILFDEDRFYHIKRLRVDGSYKPLFNDEDFYLSSLPKSNTEKVFSKLGSDSSYSLSLDHFNLVVDTFLRGQMLSLYLSSSLNRESMSFW